MPASVNSGACWASVFHSDASVRRRWRAYAAPAGGASAVAAASLIASTLTQA